MVRALKRSPHAVGISPELIFCVTCFLVFVCRELFAKGLYKCVCMCKFASVLDWSDIYCSQDGSWAHPPQNTIKNYLEGKTCFIVRELVSCCEKSAFGLVSRKPREIQAIKLESGK